MKILAKFMKVNAILIAERIPEPEGTEEPKIIIEAIKEWGEWDFSLGEKGTQGYLANFIELDIDSSLILEGLEVERISWINNAMCVYFPYPLIWLSFKHKRSHQVCKFSVCAVLSAVAGREFYLL